MPNQHNYRQNNFRRNQNRPNRSAGNTPNRKMGQAGYPSQYLQTDNIIFPYNFVPLNDKVVEAPVFPGKKLDENNTEFKLNRYYPDKLTGYIDLEIETLTPVYIRDTYTTNELNERREIENRNGRYINSDFYSPAGTIRIPGSSLRGMIRTLVEIVSFGKFTNFNGQRKFFYRALGDKSIKLRNKYHSIMTKIIYRATAMSCRAGYLIKKDSKYYIKPAKEVKINEHNIQIFRVEQNLINNISLNKYHDTYSINDNICFSYYNELNHKHRHGHIEIKLFYAKVASISSIKTNQLIKGCLVCSGSMPRKHMQHVILPPEEDDQTKKELDDRLISAYKNDTYRNGINLIDLIDKHPDLKLPCFYITDSSNSIVAFGHTPYFRLPYKHSIGDLLSYMLKSVDVVDFAESMFGRISDKGSFTGRVFFEDAFPEGDVKRLNRSVPKVLGEPKPTCFQNYLEQPNSSPVYNTGGEIRGYDNLYDYNDDGSRIRGYKLYWHHENSNWQEEIITIKANLISDENDKIFLNSINDVNIVKTVRDNEGKISYEFNLNNIPKNKINDLLDIIKKYDTQHTIISPVDKGIKFKGRIRFENLTDEELGALLFALDLPEGCAHKIGMAKPLGLGAIKITPKLYLSERTERYRNLEREFINPIDSDKKNNEDDNNKKIKEFKKIFAQYILSQIQINKSTPLPIYSDINLWNDQRLVELKCLLTCKNNLKNISYPTLKSGHYQSREPLKKASKHFNP